MLMEGDVCVYLIVASGKRGRISNFNDVFAPNSRMGGGSRGS